MAKGIGLAWPGWRNALHGIDWRPLLIAAWSLILAQPIRETGWVGDDIINSSLPGIWIYRGVSPVQDFADENAKYIAVGRVIPVIHLCKELVFGLVHDLFWYKWLQVAAVVASLVVFYGCLRGMKADADLAGLTCLLVAGLIQFRGHLDPVYAFNCFMLFIFVVTAVSLWLLHRFQTTGSRLALAGSVLLYAAALLTYEMTYPFWLLHAWILVRTRAGWRRGALTLLPFMAIPVLLALYSLHLHSRTPDMGAYNIGADPRAVADVFIKQLVAALPCSFTSLDPWAMAGGLFSWETFWHYRAVATIGLLLNWAVTTRLVRRSRESCGPTAGWTVFGLLWAFLPIPVLCLCRGHQEGWPYGFGYLPVFIQYFGVALLMAGGVAAIGGRLRRCPPWLLALPPAVFFAAFTTLDYAGSVRLASLCRTPLLSPRCELDELMDAGLVHQVAAGGVVLSDRQFPWEASVEGVFYYCYHTRLRLSGLLTAPADADAIRRLAPNQPGREPHGELVRVRYVKPATSGSFAVAGRVASVHLGSDGSLCEVGVVGMRLAVWRGDRSDPLHDRPFVVHTQFRGPDGAVRQVDLPSGALRWVRSTRHWTLYDIDAPFPYLDSEAVRLEFPPP